MAVLESELQNALFLAAPIALPTVRLFRRQVMSTYIGKRFVKAGIKGQADIYGYIRGGKAIEIELKAARGYTSPEQLQWERFCVEWGILFLRLKAERSELVGETIVRWLSEIKKAISSA